MDPMPPSFSLESREPVRTEAKIQFLRDPSAYPAQPERVETIETHMAWVFLTPSHAYKMKKPVRYDELDFRSPERRQWACREEVRLNRRLAGEVYRGVVPLVLGADGELHLGGSGEAVDWLVKMERLPAKRMLDTMIRHHTVEETDVRRAAERLAAFYDAAEPITMEPVSYRTRIEQTVDMTTRALLQSAYRLPRPAIRSVAEAQSVFLRREADLLQQRVRRGRLVEGHGDLRPEHVCLTDPPVIFDCLEFDRSLRLLDPADELAFLAVECERLGAPSIGQILFGTYAEEVGDRPPERLIHFYQSYRALQRARIAVRHTRRPGTTDERRWADQARLYLRLARQHIEMA